MDIVRDTQDRERFTQALFYLNDTHADPNWRRETAALPAYHRPKHWPERDPLVAILGWTLLSNHFHLILKQVRDGGIAKFMQRLCGSMSTAFNVKYRERGSLFQSGYRGKLVENDDQFRYLVFYVLEKNVFDMYSGGLLEALNNYSSSWEWAKQYRFSSLHETLFEASPVLDDPDALVGGVLGKGDDHKNEARELLAFHLETKGSEFSSLMLESWDV